MSNRVRSNYATANDGMKKIACKTLFHEFTMFDSLPPWAREIVRYAPDVIACEPIVKELARGLSQQEFNAAYEHYCAERLLERHMRPVWGPGHPQARGSIKDAEELGL